MMGKKAGWVKKQDGRKSGRRELYRCPDFCVACRPFDGTKRRPGTIARAANANYYRFRPAGGLHRPAGRRASAVRRRPQDTHRLWCVIRPQLASCLHFVVWMVTPWLGALPLNWAAADMVTPPKRNV